MPTVRVPQPDGEIRIAQGGAEAQVWAVKDHQVVDVAPGDVDLIVSLIPGATAVEPDSKPSRHRPPADTPKE